LPNKRSAQISSVQSCILYLRNTSLSQLAATLRRQKALTAGLPNYRKFEMREMEKKKQNQRTVIVGFGSVRVLFEFVNGGF